MVDPGGQGQADRQQACPASYPARLQQRLVMLETSPTSHCSARSYQIQNVTVKLEPREQKWEPVLREKRCDNKKLERTPCVRFNAARSRCYWG